MQLSLEEIWRMNHISPSIVDQDCKIKGNVDVRIPTAIYVFHKNSHKFMKNMMVYGS